MSSAITIQTKLARIEEVFKAKGIRYELSGDANLGDLGYYKLGVNLGKHVWHWFRVSPTGYFTHQESYSQNTGKSKKGLKHGWGVRASLEKLVGEELFNLTTEFVEGSDPKPVAEVKEEAAPTHAPLKIKWVNLGHFIGEASARWGATISPELKVTAHKCEERKQWFIRFQENNERGHDITAINEDLDGAKTFAEAEAMLKDLLVNNMAGLMADYEAHMRYNTLEEWREWKKSNEQ